MPVTESISAAAKGIIRLRRAYTPGSARKEIPEPNCRLTYTGLDTSALPSLPSGGFSWATAIMPTVSGLC